MIKRYNLRDIGRCFIGIHHTQAIDTLRSNIHACKDFMETYRLINLIFLCSVNVFFTFAGLFLNSVVIICLWKSAQLRKGTGNFMILVLSACDLIVVGVGHPSIIFSTVSWSTADTKHKASHSECEHRCHKYGLSGIAILATDYTQGFAMTAFLAVTIDRFLAITRPLFHKIHVTKRRLLAILVALQLLIIVIRLSRFFKEFKTIYDGAAIAIPATEIILLAGMNCKMCRIAANTRRKKQATKMQTALLKTNCTCLLTAACFFVCVIPFVVYIVLRSTSTGLSKDTLMLIRLWSGTSLNMSSTFNSVIFFWRNEKLRKAGNTPLPGCLKLER